MTLGLHFTVAKVLQYFRDQMYVYYLREMVIYNTVKSFLSQERMYDAQKIGSVPKSLVFHAYPTDGSIMCSFVVRF